MTNYKNWKNIENFIPVTPITVFPSKIVDLAAYKAWSK
jgi:hypothetical protein